MNWDQIEGQWKQRRGKALRLWGKMMNDELATIAGKHEELVGRIQEKYGIGKEESKVHVRDFKKIVGQLKISNRKLMQLQIAFLKTKKPVGRKPLKTKTLAGKNGSR